MKARTSRKESSVIATIPFEISVENGSMYMRQRVGDGESNGLKYDLAYGVGCGTFVLGIEVSGKPETRRNYCLTPHRFLQACAEHFEQAAAKGEK